jgi:YD repeat-containing protein
MALDDAERKAERPRESGPAAPESAFQEANAGRQDLIREQRAQTEYLRAGGRSGITSEFGRMVITGLDAASDEPGRAAGSEEPPDRTAARAERPDAAQARSGGFGRMLMDGLQAVSRGLRIGERPARSARAELGEEAPAETGEAHGRTIYELPRPGAEDGRTIQELPEREPGGLGRMLMDGLQAISRGLRIGEGQRRSAQAELGEETSTESRAGYGGGAGDRQELAPAGAAPEHPEVEAAERADRHAVAESGDRTAEATERLERRLAEIDEFPAPSREALARAVDTLMRVLRQTLEGPAGSRPDSPDVETLAGAASARSELREPLPAERPGTPRSDAAEPGRESGADLSRTMSDVLTATVAQPLDFSPDSLLRRAEQMGDLLGVSGRAPADAQELHRLLDIMPQAERREISAAFERQFGMPLEEQMSGVFAGDDLTRALHLMRRTDAAQGAERLFATLTGSERPEDSVMQLLNERTPDQLRQLDQYFQLAYGSTLADQLTDRLSGTGLTQALDLLGRAGVVAEPAGRGGADGALPPGDYVPADLTHPRGSPRTDGVSGETGRARGTAVREAGERSYLPTDSLQQSDTPRPDAIPDRPRPSGDREREGTESSTMGILGTHIERDSQGRPTEIEYPDGTTRTVEYDEHGPSRIHSSRGGELTRGQDGTWTLTDREGHSREVRNVTVSANGDISYEREDGILTYRPDGSTIGCERAADGAAVLRQVHYPDGHYDVITYDGTGRPAEVRSTEGESWRRDADGWNHYDADGNVTEHFDGNVTAAADGTISFLNEAGEGFVRHPNGGLTEARAGGAAIFRDAEGNVRGVDYPDGTSRSMEYDEHGLARIHSSRGGELTRGDDGRWTLTDSEGNTREVRNVSVSPDGDISYEREDGILTYRPDGSTIGCERAPDGTLVLRQVHYPDGHYDVITYDGAGRPSEVRSTEGDTWRRDADGWNHYDRQGNRTEHFDGNVTASADGTISFLNDAGAGFVRHPNGGVTECHADGSAVYRDAHGNVIGQEAPSAAGERVEIEVGPVIFEEPSSPVEVEIGQAVIEEPGRDIDVEIGEAVIEEPPPDFEVVFGEPIMDEPQPDIEVVFGDSIFETTERWGSREYTVLSDGTAEYTVQRGDTVWSIAREALEHRHPDHDPTGREILQEVRRIARDSGLEDPNVLHPGDRIVIRPESAESAAEAPVREATERAAAAPVGEAAERTAEAPVGEAAERTAEAPAREAGQRAAEAPVREAAESGPPPEVVAGGSPELGTMAAQLIERMPAESLSPVVQQILSTVPAASLAPLAAQMIDQLPPEALQPIAAELLRRMPADMLPPMAGPLLEFMPTDLLAPMAAEMIANMPVDTLEPLVEQMIQHMPPEALASIGARMLDGMPAGALEPLVSQMLERTPADQLAPIAEQLIENVPPDQLAPILEQLTDHVTPDQLAQLVGPLLEHIPPDQLAQIAAPLIEHVPPDQLAPIAGPLIAHIPPEQLGQFGAPLIQHVPPEQLAPFAAQLLEHVPPDRLGPIASELFERVPPDRLAPFAAELIDHVPPDRLGPVAAELIEHVPPEQLAPVAARLIAEMPAESLTPVLAQMLRQLPAESLAPVAAEILSRMPAESLRPLAAQMLRELPAEFLPSVAGPMLGFLPADALAPMTAEMIANMPPEALEPMVRQMIEHLPPERLAPLAARMVDEMPADALEPVVEQMLDRMPRGAAAPLAEQLVREAATDAPVDRASTERREDIATRREVDGASLERAVDQLRAATHRDDVIDTGTEERDFLGALRGRSEADLSEMNRIYQERYGTTLEEEARRELDGPELQMALNYLNREAGLPAEIPEGVDRAAAERRVEQLHTAAYAHGATGDADAFCRALEGTSPAERQAMDAIYRERYGLSIAQEVDFRLLGDDSTRAFSLLNAAGVAGSVPAGVDRAAMEERVERIYRSTHRGDLVDTGTEERDFLDALRGTTAEERRVMDQLYRERHGRSLSAEIDSELSETDRQMAYNLLNAEGVAGAAAEIPEGVDRADLQRRLDAIRAATGVDDVIDTGTDSGTILENLRGLSEEDRAALAAMYLEQHGITLRQQLRAEMDPADFDRAAAILSTGSDAAPPADRPAVDTSGVDRDRMLELARQIRAATHRDDLIDTGTEDDVILRAIEGRSEAERVVLAEIYQREYGISLHEEVTSEMSDALSVGSLGRARVALEGREADLHAEGVDPEALQSVVEQIWNAPITDPTGSGAEGIATLLESRSEAERRAIDTLFMRTYGRSLEEYIDSPMPVPGQFLAFSDAERDHLRNLLHREDGSADFAGRIHSSLIELGQTLRGRDSDTVEQGLRTTLAVMNSEDIAALDREYRERYHVSLRDALMEDEHLSARTREVLDIYLRGSDHRTEADTERLATIALENEDLTMFEEAFRSASPEARSAFMEAGGEARIRAAFGMHIDDVATMSGTDLLTGHGTTWDQRVAHALDYARYGELSLATSIRDETNRLGDNETAIETAIGSLSDEERGRYRRGRELVQGGADEASLSTEDRAAVAYYRDGHAALEGAGNETEVARWEDMIMVEGGSMISRLAAHAGTVYDDSMDDVLSDIEGAGMSDQAWAEHWRRLTTEPGYRQDIENALRTYLSEDELARATALLDRQAAAGSAEEARSLGRRPILEAISDADGTITTTERHVVEAISHMTEEDQRRYRDDADFRRQLDAAVAGAMEEGPELDAARRLLDRVARGEAPTMDIITRLQLRAAEQDESDALTEAGVVAGGVMLAPMTGGLSLAAAGAFVADEELSEGEGFDTARTALVGSRAADTIRDLEEEFREHPEVRERILNPTTDEDRQFHDQFYTALQQTMSEADIERYAEPLIRDGRLPMETQMELNRGIADDSETASYDDLVTLARDTSETADAERARILTDQAYQDQVLGHLSADERQIALSILGDESVAYIREHGEMRPVDALRAHMVGAGTGEEEIRSVLSRLSPEQQDQVRDDYARIYGRDLRADLVSELGGSDLTEAMRMTRGPASAEEDFAAALDDYLESRDGLGSTAVDRWDGTGFAADDALHQYAAAMTEFSARFEELPPERRRELEENLATALEQFRESRGAMADAVVDTVIAIAAVGGAVFTDGISLSLLACTGFGAAIFKVATRAAIMGGDYDFASMAGIDAATGFVDGFMSMAGPGEFGAMLRVGERAAATAATRVATEGGERLLRAGAEEALERSITRAVRDAFVSGSDRISEETIERIAREVAREGLSEADEAALRTSIRNSLRDSIAAESRSALERIGTEYGLNMAAGAMGGGSSGMIRGFAEWDPERSFEDNLAMVGRMTLTSAGFGAGGAGAFTAVFGAGSAMVRGIRDHFHLRPGEHLTPEQLAEAASRMGVPDGHLRQTPDGDLVLTGGAPERAPGDRDAIVPPPPERAPGDRDAIVPPPPERAPGDRDAIVPPPPEGAPVPAHGGSDFPRTRPGIDAHGDTIPPTRTGVDPHGDTVPPPRPEGEPRARASSDEPRGMEVERLEGDRRRIHASDGSTHELIPVQSDWMYPARPPRGPVDRAVKLHVFSTGGEDLARLQDVLIPALENDPVLRELVPHWKTRDPLLAAEGSRAGADLEAFTIAVSDPADVPRVQQRIDEILAEHPELTLDRPIRPGGVDTIAGTSGRVGHLRDFFPVTRDAEGALGARVDDALSQRIHESAGVAEGARLSPDQLRTVERNAGLREGSLAYDADGNLMLLTTDEASTVMEGQLYVGTHGAESHPAGERYMRDGVEVESEGLTDRYAYYRLGEIYGVDPAESVISGAVGHADTLPPPARAEAPAGEAHPPSGEAVDVLAETMPPPPPREAAVGPGSRSGGDDALADTIPPGRAVRAAERPGTGADAPGAEHGPARDTIVDGEPVRERDTIVDTPLGAPHGSAEEIPADVLRVMDQAGVLPEERAAFMAYLRDNPLFQPELMDRISRELSEITSGWPDRMGLAIEARGQAERLERAFSDCRRAVFERLRAPDGSNEVELTRLLQHPDELRAELQTQGRLDDEMARRIDTVVAARGDFAQAQESLSRELRERTDQIQEVLNRLADEQGLPRVRVGSLDLGPRTAGTYLDGVVTLHEAHLLGVRDPVMLMTAAYHEFVHNGQDALMIRRVIDDVEDSLDRPIRLEDFDRLRELRRELRARPGDPASVAGAADDTIPGIDPRAVELQGLESRFQQIRDRYREMTGGEMLTDDHLADVLRARGDRRLTPDERARAGHMLPDWLTSGETSAASRRAREDVRILTARMRRLVSDADGPSTLIRELREEMSLPAEGRTLSRHLFGSSNPPEEVQALIARGIAGAEQEQEARLILIDVLSERHMSESNYLEILDSMYRGQFHEQEAFVIGESLASRARERGPVAAPDTPRAHGTAAALGSAARPRDTLPYGTRAAELEGPPPSVPGEDRPTLRVPPPEVAPSVSPSGDAIRLGPHDFGVVDQSGDSVLLRRLSRPLPVGEPRIATADELARGYTRIGESDYYFRTSDRTIHAVRRTESGDIQMREDPNIAVMHRERFLLRSGGIPPEEFPRLRAADSAAGGEAE